MTYFTPIIAGVFLATAGAALAQNGGPANCPEGYETMAPEQLSEKCRSELSQMGGGASGGIEVDATGSTGAAQDDGAPNSVLQPPKGSNSSSQ